LSKVARNSAASGRRRQREATSRNQRSLTLVVHGASHEGRASGVFAARTRLPNSRRGQTNPVSWRLCRPCNRDSNVQSKSEGNSGSDSPNNLESNGQSHGESNEDGDSDRNGRSYFESYGRSNEGSDPESDREGNRESDSGRNGLNNGEGNARSDAENNLDSNWESYGGGDGGEFRKRHLMNCECRSYNTSGHSRTVPSG
jgi:hypothetical protein